MHQNVAVAEAVVLSCFRQVSHARNRICFEQENFPSVRYLYQAQPELDVVACPDLEQLLDDLHALDGPILVARDRPLEELGEPPCLHNVAPSARPDLVLEKSSK